jgi:hypothetical protein
MPKISILNYLNAYEDASPSNAPNRSFFRWTRDIKSIFCNNPTSLDLTLAPGETRELFSGMRTLTQDGTTQYSISLVPMTTTEYQLTWSGGTNPTFRTARTTGANSSTEVTVTVNSTVVTFTSTVGTPFNLISGGVVVGDYVIIGNQFNPSNQGTWQIISMTNTSFSVVNDLGVAEGPISLGVGYATQVQIFSAAGVQVGDTLVISGGFSPVTQGSYTITAVSSTYLQFSSVNPLPTEGPITTEDITIYFLAKKLVYMESDQDVALTINGVSGVYAINPLLTCECASNRTLNQYTPGMFMQTSTIYSLSITNTSINTANVFFASVE